MNYSRRSFGVKDELTKILTLARVIEDVCLIEKVKTLKTTDLYLKHRF